MAFRGSELHNSGEQGRLEYSEEVDRAGNESDQGTNNRVHDASELQSDQSDYMKDNKKALVSSPRVHEASELPSDESDNLKNQNALLSFPSSSRVHDASELPSDQSDVMKNKKPLARLHDASELPSDESDDMKNKKALVSLPSPASVHDGWEHSDDMSNNIKKKKLLVSYPSRTRVRDWSELPRDISNLIADKMRFVPHLQKFGAACKEWRDVTCEIIKPLTAKIKSEPPMLLLPYNEETHIASFLEIKNSKMYDVKMPELKDKWTCGFSNGWLAMVDKNLDVFLFNPLTRARIKLPPLPPYVIEWFHKEYDATEIYDRSLFIRKVVLFGDPSSSNCLIAIIYSGFRMFGVCRLGDEYWSVEHSKMNWGGYEDVIFYEGKIFVAKDFGDISVFEYHMQGNLRKVKQIKQPFQADDVHSLTKNIVESCGDLFCIMRFGKWGKSFNVSKIKPDKTLGFEVYRFKPASKKKRPWSRVCSLGDRSLFVGLNDCICMSVKEFPWCKANCIYFFDDRGKAGYNWDNGVYSLEENRVIWKFDIRHSFSVWDMPAIWYQPRV